MSSTRQRTAGFWLLVLFVSFLAVAAKPFTAHEILANLAGSSSPQAVEFAFKPAKGPSKYGYVVEIDSQRRFVWMGDRRPSFEKVVLDTGLQLAGQITNRFWYFLGDRGPEIFDCDLDLIRGCTNEALIKDAQIVESTVRRRMGIVASVLRYGLPDLSPESLVISAEAFTANSTDGIYSLKGKVFEVDGEAEIQFTQTAHDGSHQAFVCRPMGRLPGTELPAIIKKYAINGSDEKLVITIELVKRLNALDRLEMIQPSFYHVKGLGSHYTFENCMPRVSVFDPKRDYYVRIIGVPFKISTVRLFWFLTATMISGVVAWLLLRKTDKTTTKTNE